MSSPQLMAEIASLPQTAVVQQEAHWYAIRVRCQFEKKAGRLLLDKGIEAFVPTIKQRRRWSDRWQVVEFPIFAGYAFVHIDRQPSRRLQVLQTCGVMSLVSFGGEPVPIPAKQIEDVRLLSTRDVPYAPYPFIRIGQRVRIRGGCLDSIEGVLTSNENDKVLVISIEPIQRSIAVSIADYKIEPA